MPKKRIKTFGTLLATGVFFLCLPVRTRKADVLVHGESVACTREENPYGWTKLSSYTTYFSAADEGRRANILLAAALVDGATIQPYGAFSFNGRVGARTEEAGFQTAKVILNGAYAQGVGGGVCQVSTTLYNAALLAGQQVTEYHPHSLCVGYVPPSRDAMVSSASDLKFVNALPHPVHISAKVVENAVRVVFYGKNEGGRYEITSVFLEKISPPSPLVREGEEDEVLRAEKEGMRSEAYLSHYAANGALLSRRRLRADVYAPVQGIIVKKVVDTTN